MTNEKRLELLAELRGTKCQCGKKKQARRTFCARCYYALPGQMRQDLYHLFGHGYEDSYATAMRCLKPGETK